MITFMWELLEAVAVVDVKLLFGAITIVLYVPGQSRTEKIDYDYFNHLNDWLIDFISDCSM